MTEPLQQQVDDGARDHGQLRAALIQKLFEEHNRKLVCFLRTRLHDEQDAIEVAQEAYVQLLQLEKSGSASFLQAYLFRIARNLAVDRVRRCKVRSLHRQEPVAADSLFDMDLEKMYLAGESLQLFWRAVHELPEKCREAFLASRFQETRAEEIAERMKISARMVRKYVVQALVYCRLRLDGLSEADARKEMRGTQP